MNELVPWNRIINTKALRRTIIRMSKAGNSVHLGSSFSIVEIVATLYQDFVRLNWHNRNDPNRDILALSKGHGVMALYSVFYDLGWLSDKEIDNYFASTNVLKGLSSANVSGIEVSGGSLGHGISVATGIALAAKLKNTDQRVFAIVGDGEMDEGSVWESLMIAAHFELKNLIVIIDVNKFQAMGQSKPGANIRNFKEKLLAFNFETEIVDGHNQKDLALCFDSLLKSESNHPKAVIANTIKGRGVSFMENDNNWHYLRMDDASYSQALRELSE